MPKESARNQFYKEKSKLLEKLIQNLKKEKESLRNGDPDSAIQVEFANEKILQKLEALDQNHLEEAEGMSSSMQEITQSEMVFHLLDEARELQREVQIGLSKALEDAKSEYLEVKVKRQLKNHFALHTNLSWTKNYC